MEKTQDKCILCGKNRRALLIEKDGWKVYKCSSCGLGVLDPRPSADETERLYTDAYFADQYDRGLKPGTPEFRKRLSLETHRIRFFRGLKRRGRILDIGCGNGYFLAACLKRGYEVMGLDVSDWATRYVTQTLRLSATAGQIDAVDLPVHSYDVITMWHFLEHARDPKEALIKAGHWVKKDGLLVIEVPNYEGTDARRTWAEWVGWQLPYHFYHFTPSALRGLLNQCGFRVIKEKDYHSEVVKSSLRKVPVIHVFARLIARMYSGTSIAVIAVRGGK